MHLQCQSDINSLSSKILVRVDYGTLNVTIYHSSSCCFVIALGDCYKWISGRLFGPMTKDFGCDVYLFTPRPISCYRDSSYFSQGQNENTKHNIASMPSIYLPSRHPSRLPDTHVCLTVARLSLSLIYPVWVRLPWSSHRGPGMMPHGCGHFVACTLHHWSE